MATRSFIQIGGKDVDVRGRLLRVARLDGEKYTFPEDLDALIHNLKQNPARIDVLTFLQRPWAEAPKYDYANERDNLAVLPISTFDHWFNKQIRSVPRNRARQAEKKGVVLREVPFDDALARGIWEIHNESPVRQGRQYPHYGLSLEEVREPAATFLDRSIFIGAYLGEKLIGFAKLIVDDTKTYACMVSILSKLEHRDKAPTNALIAQAVRSCADRGISYLVYEHYAYGTKPADSLQHFKDVNGFIRLDLQRYYVPLTLLGSVSLRLGLHRRLVDYLPESWATKLRTMRTNWYAGKLQASPDNP